MRRGIPAAAAVVMTVAGCGGGVDVSPVENPITGSVPAAAPTASLPPMTGRWAGLTAKCPALTGPVATRFGLAGAGRPTDEYNDFGDIVHADCAWGSTDSQGYAATARISIYQRQEGADAQWQALRTGQTDPVAGLGREAFASTEPDGMAVRVLSNNAVAVVRLRPPASSASADGPGKLRDPAITLTKDVLDDLR
ncbi:hypothetical protein [Couchioplanes caeruleus]|uniref:DUF3558 domain-containing protein n=2 Tax=Couchioplanes caeruleus TaxID=56438 RepID=A0A1K0FBV4_9ACTN|nr:hypothetical protein [Couchioplanes caeruleus]OJF10313.1 hypothetical protein BG844_32575 [Couchioplanes caeruleus subsp. caeruleus]ROP30038.1 hypothetical protein EDD30_2869 [Couchioplanes caeruleus]